MVTPAETSAQEGVRAGIGARLIRRVNAAVGVNRVKDGLTIGPLRATGGPPSSGVAQPLAASSRQESSGLLDLPQSGRGVLSSLGAQTSPASPLTAGLAEEETSPLSLGVLQTRQRTLRQQFQRFDNQSRFLQVLDNPRRAKGGFGLTFSGSTLNLLG